MKRSAKIYILLLVWISAMLQFFINDKLDINETLAQVSGENEEISASALIVAWGVYGDDGYSDRTAQKIITNTGAQFGLTRGKLDKKDISSGRYVSFSGNAGDCFYQTNFILDEQNGCSYLVLCTDNTKDIRTIRTFYTKLNIEYHMYIDIDLIGMPDGSEDSVFEAFRISHLEKKGTTSYGKVHTEVPFSEFKSNKNVRVTVETGCMNIEFGDRSDLNRLGYPWGSSTGSSISTGNSSSNAVS